MVAFTDATAWHWVKVGSSVNLAAGTTHALFLAHGKCGAQLDQVLVTDDLSYIPQSAPVFASGSQPAAASTGAAYNYTFAILGSPAPTFTLLSGSLPPGLALSSAGVISGTPTAAGTYSGTVSAMNNFGGPVTQAFTIVVTTDANTDSPTLPPWGVPVLICLLMICATRFSPKLIASSSLDKSPEAE